jgi:membrane fusion protein (multidrug efflux system)
MVEMKLNGLTRSRALVFAATIGAVLALVACGTKKPAPAAAVPEVGVITLQAHSTDIVDELPGRTVAYRIAEVRPQISGIVKQRLFTEGSEVRAGEPLFRIDDATYVVALRSAQAALQRAQAQQQSTRALRDRYDSLLAANLVSKQAYDDAVAGASSADADIEAARAQVQAARINLVYTKVLAPISGRIGRTLVTEGALVKSEQDAPLAQVQQLDPIYVDISQSSVDILRLKSQLDSGQLQGDAKNQAEVKLKLEDGREYPETGKLQFSELSVDPGTGAVLLRALFPNPRRELLPGMFVRARLTQAVKTDALLVPQRGVTRNQRGDAVVLVVGEGDVVVERVVTADRAIGNDWLITAGVVAGDRIILDGLQKVRPGIRVRAVAAATSTAAGSTAHQGQQ